MERKSCIQNPCITGAAGTPQARIRELSFMPLKLGRRTVQAHYERGRGSRRGFRGWISGSCYRTSLSEIAITEILYSSSDQNTYWSEGSWNHWTEIYGKNYGIIVENMAQILLLWILKLGRKSKVRGILGRSLRYSALITMVPSFALKGVSICFCLTINAERSLIGLSGRTHELCMHKDVGTVVWNFIMRDDTSMQVLWSVLKTGTLFIMKKNYHRILSGNYLCTGLRCSYSCLHDGEEVCIDAVREVSEELAVAFIDIDFCINWKGGISDHAYNP